MIKVLLLLTLILSTTFQAAPAATLARQIKSLPGVLKNAGSPPADLNCNGSLENQSLTSTLYSPHNRKNVELTVLSPERAREIFTTLKNDEDNSFNYPADGCYARAHRMAMVMDEMGVISGKAFVEGELFVQTSMGEIGWTYHVASLVLVKKDGKLVPTVFDPGLFDRPVPFEEWKALLLKDSKSSFQSEYFTKRFNYDPDARHDDLDQYNEEQVEDMKAAIKGFSRLGHMFEYMDNKEKGQ